MNLTTAQIAVTRARHIVRRATRQGGAALKHAVTRAIQILVAEGATLNEAVSFVLNVRRSVRAA